MIKVEKVDENEQEQTTEIGAVWKCVRYTNILRKLRINYQNLRPKKSRKV